MMMGFQQAIKHQLNQINGLIILLRNGVVRRNWRGTAGFIKSTSELSAKAITVQRGIPTVRKTTFLFAALLPVVKAWGPWKSKNDDDEPAKFGLRLQDGKNKVLREDIRRSDELYDRGKAFYDDAYKVLQPHAGKREPEVWWRIARFIYEKSKLAKSTEEKRQLIEEAYDLVLKSLAIDDKHYAIHKWMAILINELSFFKGIKAQILESVNVKNHMLKAAELNPDDATSIYLLGHWCYTVADIPWYQRKVAATLFAEPPKCSFNEAYSEFLRAEMTEPGFYSMNLLMLAKSCIKLNELEKAEEYLVQLKNVKVKTEDDYMAKTEGKKLREGLFKSRNFDATKEPVEEEVKA